MFIWIWQNPLSREELSVWSDKVFIIIVKWSDWAKTTAATGLLFHWSYWVSSSPELDSIQRSQNGEELVHWFPSPALPTRWQLRRSSIKKKGRYSGLAARSLPYPDLSFSMESAPVLFWDFYTGSGCSFKRRGETPYPESHLPFYTLLRFRIGRIARFDTSTYNSFWSKDILSHFKAMISPLRKPV